jgi:phage shock protein A
MSVLDRMNRLVRANLNDLASRASGRRMFGEVRETLREGKAQLVESRMAEKRLNEEYQTLLDESQAWEDRAVLALRAGDESLARRALERKYEVDGRARGVKQDLDAHRAHITDLHRSFDAIEVKLQALRERGRAASHYDAPLPRTATPTEAPIDEGLHAADGPPPRWARTEADAELGTLGRPELFDDFEAMSSRLTRAEAELDAIRELHAESGPLGDLDPLHDDLEARFRDLEADRDLARLKDRAQREPNDLDALRRRLDEE